MSKLENDLANASRIMKNNQADHEAEIKAHGITRDRLLSTQDKLANAKYDARIWSIMYLALLAGAVLAWIMS